MRRRQYVALAVAALAGCTTTDDDDDDRSHVYEHAMQSALEDDGATVHELSVEENVAEIEYTPAEPTEESIQASIETGARAVYDRVYGGWDVDRLDARVVVDGELVVTWHVEREWVEQHRAGEISRDEFGRLVEDSVEEHVDR